MSIQTKYCALKSIQYQLKINEYDKDYGKVMNKNKNKNLIDEMSTNNNYSSVK